MKRFTLLLIAATLFTAGTSFGWGRLGHATIAKIAETHLSPKAKKQIDKYLNGRSIIYYASYPDDYRQQLLIDLGFEPSNGPRITVWGHSYQADAEGKLIPGERRGTEYVKNCTGRLEKVIEDLKNNHREMSDSARVVALALVVHLVGDIHCPKHIRYIDEPTSGGYKVVFQGNKVSYHAYWDGHLLQLYHRWGYNELASLLDICDKKQRAELAKGDIYTWAEENARKSRYTVDTKPDTKITRDMINRDVLHAESQIQRAGYRLAATLNQIFK